MKNKKRIKKAVFGEEIDPITGKPVPQLKQVKNDNWIPSSLFGLQPVPQRPQPATQKEKDELAIMQMETDPEQRGEFELETIRPVPEKEEPADPRRGVSPAVVGVGLQMLNELLPAEPIKRPVVRPQLVANDNPNGTGSQAIYEDGGSVKKGHQIEFLSDQGNYTPISINPHSGETIQFLGPSHEQGGIDIKYGNKEIEVEGDEVAFKDSEGNLQIMGNMIVPGTKQKFKNATKEIAAKEMKIAKKKSLALQMMQELDPRTPAENLAKNAAVLNIKSADAKQKQLANRKFELASLQAAILETAAATNTNPDKLAKDISKPKAKKGMKVVGEDPVDGKVAKKFDELRAATILKLQALYPGKKVDIVMNRERDIRTQRGLKGSGASKTSVSLHNFGGAADFTIKVDGKIIDLNTKGGLDVYKQTLHAAAKEKGMYTVGDWDPYHVGLVQEGKGKTFSSLFSQYPELKKTKRYQDTLSYLEELVNKGEADDTELRTYNFLTGKKGGAKQKKGVDYGDYSKFVLPEKRKGRMVGENFFEDLPEIINNQNLDAGNPVDVNDDGTLVEKEKADVDLNIEYQGNFDIKNPKAKKKGTNVEKLRFTQILPEVVAQVTNQPEPVWMQQFAPEYLQPYDISLQDQINENNASFNAMERMVNDPNSLAILAAQKYQANQKVLAEQFRINQGIEADVIAKNTATANDAQLKNLALADQQYVRQETAKSKTNTLNREILNSISAKELQHSAAMKRLAVWENMYDYRFVDSNKDGIADVAEYQGPEATFDFFGPLGGNTKQKNSQTVTLDQFGVPIRTQKKTEDVVPIETINTIKRGEHGASIPSLYNQMMKKMR